MANNNIDNCSIINRANLRQDIDNPNFYTRVNPNDLVVGENYMFRWDAPSNDTHSLPVCVKILENTSDVLRFKKIDERNTRIYNKAGTMVEHLMRFYKKRDWYGPRKNYLKFTESIAPGGTSFNPGPAKYLTDEMNKRELSSYLGPQGGKKSKPKTKYRKTKKNNKRYRKYRKTKSKK